MSYIPEALRREVRERAGNRCEYCHLPSHVVTFYPHEIDHIYAEKHGGDTNSSNLCVACYDCNRNKGSDLCSLDPLTNDVVALFHPRRDQWDDHFQLHRDGILVAATGAARATLHILRCNQPELAAERGRLLNIGLM